MVGISVVFLFCIFVYGFHPMFTTILWTLLLPNWPTHEKCSGYTGWKVMYHLFWVVSYEDAQLLGAVAQALHHLAPAEVQQVPLLPCMAWAAV